MSNRMAEGYRRRADRDAAITEEMDGTSAEVNEHLGDSPEW